MISVCSDYSTVNFRGLYKVVNIKKCTDGSANINKTTYKLKEFVYLPFQGESPEYIKNEINKNFVGRKFSLWENDHGHVEGTYYMMNSVRVGDVINLDDKEKYIQKGYFDRLPEDIIKSDAFFRAVYNNEAYRTLDERKLSKEEIQSIEKEIKWE